MSKIHVIIYSRPGCHLCDEAKAAIISAGNEMLNQISSMRVQNGPFTCGKNSSARNIDMVVNASSKEPKVA